MEKTITNRSRREYSQEASPSIGYHSTFIVDIGETNGKIDNVFLHRKVKLIDGYSESHISLVDLDSLILVRNLLTEVIKEEHCDTQEF